MAWFTIIDTVIAWLLGPAAIAVLISGLDDLAVTLVCLFDRLRTRKRVEPQPSSSLPRLGPDKRIAIFVPCWQEADVIAKMIEHNVAAIPYRPYDFFIGAYPNDRATQSAVRELEKRFNNVHLAVCPHDGPTSKADCLNWIYQRMLLFEEDKAIHFEILVTHDAEDLIHPEALALISSHIDAYDMVQVPVLPLATPIWDLTHGIYCDEFAEFQWKDMCVRGIMGSFIPSSGVGTGYSRGAIERLAQTASNRIFDPGCLTEDYENGIRLSRLGCPQRFISLRRSVASRGPKDWIATREFFPANCAAAIQQRTRWVTGIALQSWDRHGWSGTLSHKYWMWRDRKGLICNPLSFLTNVLFLLGLMSWYHSMWAGLPWGFSQYSVNPLLLACTFVCQLIHLGVRITVVSAVYDWKFAMGVPVRTVWANYINGVSSFRAIYRYFHAKLHHQPLIWVKTAHAYPTRNALLVHKRRLGEVLLGAGYIDREQLERGLTTQPPGVRIGAHLVDLGYISEDELYEALSLQQSLPLTRIDPALVKKCIARGLPRRVIKQWQVLPYRLEARELLIASPEIPSDETQKAVRNFTKMNVSFQLVTPANFEELVDALL